MIGGQEHQNPCRACRANPVCCSRQSCGLGEGKHEAAYFVGEWMMLPVACGMQPEDLSCRAGRCQGVQHGQNGRCSDPCAEQHHRSFSGLQGKASAWRTHIEDIACPNVIPQVAPGRSARLDLHADPIVLRRLRTRERVAANERRAVGSRKAQDQVLAG